jgi:hypothetical protein
MQDLIVLVADHNTGKAIDALFQRHGDLGIRAVDFKTQVHPQ